jgi:hypothetical protein
MMRRQVIIGAAAMATLAACGEAIDKSAFSGPPAEVVTLDPELTALKTTFNAEAGKVRLLFVAGPSCGPCLRALIDLDKALGKKLLSDPRLKVFVVYVPTLSAELTDAQRASRLIGGTSVQHFWDESGHIGDVLQQTLGLDEYAWDVWLTYGPEQQWTGDIPPKPDVWSHQLDGVTVAPFLDAEKVAADVRSRLEHIG